MIRTDLSPEDRALLKRLIGRLGDGPIRGAEVGVARGETSAWLLETFPNLHLTMVDSWAEYPEDHPYRESGDGCAKLTSDQQLDNMKAALAVTAFSKGRHIVFPGDSVEQAKRIKPNSLNFALLDGDHTLEGVRRDLAAYAPLLIPGGLLCLHDLDHPRDKRGIWGVRRAGEEFAAESLNLSLQSGPRTNLGWFEPFG